MGLERSGLIVFKAGHPTKCAACSGRIVPGDWIRLHDQNRAYAHSRCPAPSLRAAPQAAPRSKAARNVGICGRCAGPIWPGVAVIAERGKPLVHARKCEAPAAPQAQE